MKHDRGKCSTIKVSTGRSCKFQSHANFKALLLAMAVFGSKPNLTTTMQELLEPILAIDRQI
jgi:hypothetical protein